MAIATIRLGGFISVPEAARRMGTVAHYIRQDLIPRGFPAYRIEGTTSLLLKEEHVNLYIATHPNLGNSPNRTWFKAASR